MTDPVSSPPPPPTPPLPSAGDDLAVLILRAAANLQNITQKISIEGEVTGREANGALRIQTAQGEIVVKIPPGEPIPKTGNTVRIEIEPGNPPKTARIIVQDAPDVRPPPTPRDIQTPVDIEIRPAQQTPPPPPPNIGQRVTLEAITPEAAQKIIAENINQKINAAAKIIDSTIQDIKNSNAAAIDAAIPQKTITISDPELVPNLLINSNTDAAINIKAPQFLNLPGAQRPVTANTAFSPALIVQNAIDSPDSIIQSNFWIKTGIVDENSISGSNTVPINARVTSIQLPDGAAFFAQGATNSKPMILTNAPAGAATGVILGHSNEGLHVAGFNSSFSGSAASPATPDLFFTIDGLTTEWPPGTMISILPSESENFAAPLKTTIPHNITAPIVPGAAALPLSFLTPGPWPLMDEIFQVLTESAPMAARAFSNVAPSPGNPAQMGSLVMLFVAAMRGGDLMQWLGDRAVETLRREGRNSLISRLSSEGNALSRTASETLSGDWRTFTIPLMWDNQIQKMTLHYKEDPSGGESEKGGKQIRFLFEVKLDRMGGVQIDGLFRPRRLDLILRTAQPLSQPMQMKIRESYIRSLETTEIRGELTFQSSPAQWVTIKAAAGNGFGTSA